MERQPIKMRVPQSPRTWLILLCAALVPLSCAFLYSWTPPNPDQMELNYAGWRMLQGDKPYVDVMSCNWPGSLWMHMGSIAAFGNTLHAWRIADALLMLATVAGLGWFFATAFDFLTAVVVVLFYPLLFYAGGWLTGQRDFVAMHLMLLAAAFHWKAWTSANWRWQIGTGLCIAYATLIKPPYFLALPALLVQAWSLSRSLAPAPGVRRKQIAAAVLATGIAIGLGLVVVVAAGTPFRAFWEMAVQFHLDAYAQEKISVAGRLRNIVHWSIGPWWWLTALAAVSPFLFLRSRGPQPLSRDAYLLFPLYALVSVVSLVWQGQGLMYHASGFYVCLALMALVTVAFLLKQVFAGRPLVRIAAGAVVVLFLMGITSRVKTYYLPPFQYVTGRISAENYYSRFTAGELTVAEALAFVNTIRQAGAEVHDPDKSVLVWSLANVINNESGYRDATRFHTPPILLLAKPPFAPAAAWRRTFVDDLERAKPFACVISYDPQQDPNDESYKFVCKFVRDHYRPVASTPLTVLYLRRTGTEGPKSKVQSPKSQAKKVSAPIL
jgi:hypothetical protein